MLQALTGFGFHDVVFRGVTGPEHRFDAGAGDRSACPCCSREHTSNHWSIREAGPRYIVRNYSQDCPPVQIDALGRHVEPPRSHGQASLADVVHELAREGGWNVDDIPVDGLRHGEVVEFTVRATSDVR